MNTFRTLSTFALLLTLLAACGTVVPGGPGAQPDEASARSALLAAVGDAFVADAEDDDIDLSAAPQLAAQSVEPFVVIRRRNMAREADTLTITVDLEATPPTAVAEVEVSITGVAELFEVYPDLSAPVELVGEKRIHLTGAITLEAEYVTGEWHLTGASSTAFSQGEYAATIIDWGIDPDTLQPGRDNHVATVELDEVETADQHLVIGRGRHFHPKTVLNDNGNAPDITADDDSYAGYIEVRPDARPGRHLGFIHALNYSRTVDLSEGADGYLFSYTDTLLPVVVWVDARD